MSAPIGPETVSFLMVGCQRCGTTWVDAALREHPAVYLPAQKQTYFFDENFDRGVDWYLSQYVDVEPEHLAVGEVATGYCLPHAVERMAALLPHVKLIMAMRHPVERAYSNYLTRRARRGWGQFEDVIEEEEDLLARGRYIEQIERLLQHYDRDRLLLLLYDDLAIDDRAYLRSILGHLGLDPGFETSLFGQRKNSAMLPRLRSALNRVGLRPVLRRISRSPIGDRVRRMRHRGGARTAQTLVPETRVKLVEYYRPFNDRLASLLGRDLTHWDE